MHTRSGLLDGERRVYRCCCMYWLSECAVKRFLRAVMRVNKFEIIDIFELEKNKIHTVGIFI